MTTDNSGLFSHQQEEEIIPAPCCVGLSGGSGRTCKRGPESELPVKVHPPVWAGRLGGAAGRWCVRCAPSRLSAGLPALVYWSAQSEPEVPSSGAGRLGSLYAGQNPSCGLELVHLGDPN